MWNVKILLKAVPNATKLTTPVLHAMMATIAMKMEHNASHATQMSQAVLYAPQILKLQPMPSAQSVLTIISLLIPPSVKLAVITSCIVRLAM